MGFTSSNFLRRASKLYIIFRIFAENLKDFYAHNQVSAGDGAERRSSWASSSAAAAAVAGGSTGSAAAALAINAQQQAQLERLYRQSIGQVLQA